MKPFKANCPDCGGHAGSALGGGKVEPCEACDGQGQVLVVLADSDDVIEHRTSDGYDHELDVKCSHNQDTSKAGPWKLWCRDCGAHGEVKARNFGAGLVVQWTAPKRDWGSGDE